MLRLRRLQLRFGRRGHLQLHDRRRLLVHPPDLHLIGRRVVFAAASVIQPSSQPAAASQPSSQPVAASKPSSQPVAASQPSSEIVAASQPVPSEPASQPTAQPLGGSRVDVPRHLH